jgi:hypothetical protein
MGQILSAIRKSKFVMRKAPNLKVLLAAIKIWSWECGTLFRDNQAGQRVVINLKCRNFYEILSARDGYWKLEICVSSGVHSGARLKVTHCLHAFPFLRGSRLQSAVTQQFYTLEACVSWPLALTSYSKSPRFPKVTKLEWKLKWRRILWIDFCPRSAILRMNSDG